MRFIEVPQPSTNERGFSFFSDKWDCYLSFGGKSVFSSRQDFISNYVNGNDNKKYPTMGLKKFTNLIPHSFATDSPTFEDFKDGQHFWIKHGTIFVAIKSGKGYYVAGNWEGLTTYTGEKIIGIIDVPEGYSKVKLEYV